MERIFLPSLCKSVRNISLLWHTLYALYPIPKTFYLIYMHSAACFMINMLYIHFIERLAIHRLLLWLIQGPFLCLPPINPAHVPKSLMHQEKNAPILPRMWRSYIISHPSCVFVVQTSSAFLFGQARKCWLLCILSVHQTEQIRSRKYHGRIQ